MHIPTTNAELSNCPTVYRDGLLDEHVIMISGGGSGMGRATAWLAARLGAQIIVCGRKEAKLLDVVASIRNAGLKADHAVLDIRSRDSVAEAFSLVFERYGKLDSLINSAGGQFPQPAIEYTDKGWDAVINTNLNGTWHMMQAAARHWVEREFAGSIINIVVVQQGLHGVAHTRAARAGVIAVSQAVSVEWASYGIRVNCIAPGAVQTEGWAVYSESAREKYPRTNPTMRAGSPWEIAEACIYLSGP
ncbi:MAG: citronellol/citronellal dehydrogenase, partial [Gammaproteobacteria bacterium]